MTTETIVLSDNREMESLPLYAIVVHPSGDPDLDGSHIVDSRMDFDPQTNQPTIQIQMDDEGARTWARLTRSQTGKSIAIVLNDRVISAPRVMSEIVGGNSQISGDFTIEEAKDLANIIRAGAAPASLYILEDEVIGPSGAK